MSFPAFLRARRLAAVPAVVLLTLLAAPGAHAGTYQVRACDPSTVNRSWTPYGDTSLIAADASCLADSVRGMKVRNSLRSPGGVPVLAGSGATGGLQAVATPGTVITGLHADATAYDEKGSSGVDGWRAGIRVDGRTDVWCAFQHMCSWIGPPTLHVDLPLSASSVQLAAICWLSTGCQRDRVRAATTLRNVTLDVRDDVAPETRAYAGDLWWGGTNLHGAAYLKMRGTDNAGVRSLAIEAGGQAVASRALPCDDYAMKPCPDDVWLESSFDTTRLPDGPSTIVIRAVDAGGQVVEDRATVTVDNVPPTVGAPDIRGGSGWRATNAFELAIDPRDGARGSGVRSVAWEVCRLDGSGCAEGSANGAPTSLAVRVPGPGEWQARAWATDAVRAGAKGPWSAPLRLDDAVPGQAAVGAAARWSTGTGPENVVLSLPPTSPSGPSGVAGYAVARGATDPGTAITHRGERALVDLGDLPEGVTTVRARSVSGAGVASAAVGEGLVRIDRTPPGVVLTTDGAPLIAPEGEWLSRGVRLRADAADQAQLSGMVSAADGAPTTDGAYVEYQVDDAAPVRVRRPGVTIDLPDDGLHVVTVRAVDAAGNMSDPQRATFRVDRNAPAGTVERSATSEPRRLRASVGEECIASAALELRPTGARDWQTHAAQVERRAVTGIVPDDRLPAGEYTARFRVRDCAGNMGLVWYGTAADPVALRLPLRDRLNVAAGITVGAVHGAASARVRAGSAVVVSGRVTQLDGTFVPGRRVEFQDRIGAGEWKLRAFRVSDDTWARVRDPPRRDEPADPPRRRRHRAGDRRGQPRDRRGGARPRHGPGKSRQPAQRTGRPLLGPAARRPRSPPRPRTRAAGVQPAQGPLAARAHAGAAHLRDRTVGHDLPVHGHCRGDGDLSLPRARRAAARPPVRRGVQPGRRGDGPRLTGPGKHESPPGGRALGESWCVLRLITPPSAARPARGPCLTQPRAEPRRGPGGRGGSARAPRGAGPRRC